MEIQKIDKKRDVLRIMFFGGDMLPISILLGDYFVVA
jgi:hypothetical protein